LYAPRIEPFFNEEMSMGNRFLRLSVVYVLLGVTLGIVMAASHDYTFRPVHAHLNLLGWASMALFGLWYRSAPAAAETRLAKAHFWLHNIALPIQMITLAMYLNGNNSAEPVLALASVVIGVGLVCFAINLWKHTGR
jgi:cbb3-type cytochrome oxidase subunit 1